MNFNSPVFLFFLLAVYGFHLVVPSRFWRLEKLALLAASYFFYAWAKPPESEQMQQYKNWSPEIKEKVLAVDAVILLLLLAAHVST